MLIAFVVPATGLEPVRYHYRGIFLLLYVTIALITNWLIDGLITSFNSILQIKLFEHQ